MNQSISPLKRGNNAVNRLHAVSEFPICILLVLCEGQNLLRDANYLAYDGDTFKSFGEHLKHGRAASFHVMKGGHEVR